nr:type II secretion system F family protein [Aquabacterium sp.]
MPQYHALWLEPASAAQPARLRQARVQAAHPQAVAAVLGVAPPQMLSVRPAGLAWPAALQWQPQRRLSLRLFSQELAVLLDAGIPLLEALQTLREKDDGAAAASPLDGVIAALRDGQPVSAALASAPRDFDALFIALVAASERSGQLATTLRDHA